VNTAVRTDFDWQRRFVPEIKRILGENLISEAPPEEDMHRNTDFIVLRLDAVRVACRIRRYKHLRWYGGQFTIRASRPSGIETELQKVIRGWGDYIFYGFADSTECHLVQWILGDLSEFRLWHARKSALLPRGGIPGELINNKDGSSTGRAYNVAELPRSFIRAQLTAGD
jgi:hypothetical protein